MKKADPANKAERYGSKLPDCKPIRMAPSVIGAGESPTLVVSPDDTQGLFVAYPKAIAAVPIKTTMPNARATPHRNWRTDARRMLRAPSTGQGLRDS